MGPLIFAEAFIFIMPNAFKYLAKKSSKRQAKRKSYYKGKRKAVKINSYQRNRWRKGSPYLSRKATYMLKDKLKVSKHLLNYIANFIK